MSAYLIALIEQHPGGAHWSETSYGPTFGELLIKYGGSLVAAAPFEQVEGIPLAESRAAIFEFPDMRSARAFWNDPQYQGVVEVRRALGTFQIFLLPGKDEVVTPGAQQVNR
jgi:uncharacterized protein (DUF1330 family)